MNQHLPLELNVFLAAIEQLSDGCYMLDRDDRLVLINHQAEELLHIDRAVALGEPFWQTLPALVATSLYHTHMHAQRAYQSQTTLFTDPIAPRPLRANLYPSNDGMLVLLQQALTEEAPVSREVNLALDPKPAAREHTEQAILRLEQLQTVVASLGRALSPTRVADVIAEQGLPLLGAVAGSVVLLDDDGETLDLVTSSGYPNGLLDGWRRFSIYMATPLSDAARLRIPIWLSSRQIRLDRYPDLSLRYPHTQPRAWAAVPLTVGERTVGALALEYDHEQAFVGEERTFILALAQQAAQAFERARLYQDMVDALQSTDQALAQLDVVIGSAPVGLALWDAELRFLHANSALAQIDHIPVRQHLGQSLAVLAPALARMIHPLLTEVLASGQPLLNIEIEHPSAPNEPHTCYLLNVYPVKLSNGQVTGVGAVVNDITSNKRSQAAQTVLGTVSLALSKALLVDDVLKAIAASLYQLRAVEAVYVARPVGASKQLPAYIDPLSGEALDELPDPAVITLFEQAVGGECWLEAISQVSQRAGAALSLVINDRIISMVGVILLEGWQFDGIDRECIRLIVQQSAQALERARLYEAERAARAEAEHALELRNQFLSVAAHELKTPLTTLMGNTQLLQRRMSARGTLTERDAHSLEVVVAQSRRLNQLITSLLDISRIQHGQLDLLRAPFDLVSMVERLVMEIEDQQGQQRIHRQIIARPLIIVGDELRLEQVLQNLLSNALKYSPNGGEVLVRLWRDQQSAWLSVSDQGIGIPADARPHVFERFYRATNALPQQINGMGVGLYVVREIIAIHGGEVLLESTEGVGSTFTVRLPL